jgi:hypothetical protein
LFVDPHVSAQSVAVVADAPGRVVPKFVAVAPVEHADVSRLVELGTVKLMFTLGDAASDGEVASTTQLNTTTTSSTNTRVGWCRCSIRHIAHGIGHEGLPLDLGGSRPFASSRRIRCLLSMER